ncbi:MAG: NUDIX hydrolase [Bacilli bacterium]|nr:NUDIX hydrolase [Bacilli bacterium]
MENSNNEIENLLIICAADEGKLKVLLKKREKEPYFGYWILPSEFIDNNTTMEESIKQIFEEISPIEYNYSYEDKTFDALNRYENKRVFALTNVVITDKQLVDLKKEKENTEWFNIDELPKIGFDHKEILEKVSKEIKYKIACNYHDILLYLFPSDFTLTELQIFYENITSDEEARKNFKKKILSQDLINDTGIKDNLGSGRPSTLYRFNVDKMRGIRL